jgi:5-methyltetrahydropteroyltriglutamate--homocysteine methyltransferase
MTKKGCVIPLSSLGIFRENNLTMKTSTDRILTTHTGSLPRPPALLEKLMAIGFGADPLKLEFDAACIEAVNNVVARQLETGIDIVSDGEMSKPGYTFYVRDRMSGIQAYEHPPEGLPRRAVQRDIAEFPDFAEARAAERAGSARMVPTFCVGPVSYDNLQPVADDIAHLNEAIAASHPVEAFINAASPGVIPLFILDTHYDDEDAYLTDLAEGLRIEYEAIHASGLLLQIDCPDLAMARHGAYQGLSDHNFRHIVARNLELLNYATQDIPADAMRMHICWGNYPGPHVYDTPIANLIDLLMTARPQAILFEAANPRHAHEWADWQAAKIPDDKILVPGVIDTSTNFVEHPRVVAERIQRFANIVGRERVIAGTDCGFATFAGASYVYDSIAWAKLKALVVGADMASDALWGG